MDEGVGAGLADVVIERAFDRVFWVAGVALPEAGVEGAAGDFAEVQRDVGGAEDSDGGVEGGERAGGGLFGIGRAWLAEGVGVFVWG